MLLAWFDHWVMELPDVPLPAKPTFVSEEGPRGAARGWRELTHWNGEQAASVTYHLTADGELSTSPREGSSMKFTQPGEAEQKGAALTFTSAALDRDRVLLGRAVLDLRAALSAPDANFYVQLNDVDADGRETTVNDGFLKASHRSSHEAPTPVPVGQRIDYTVSIRPQHHRFVKGHRVRLRVWGGARDTVVQLPEVDVEIERATLRMPGFAEAY